MAPCFRRQMWQQFTVRAGNGPGEQGSGFRNIRPRIGARRSATAQDNARPPSGCPLSTHWSGTTMGNRRADPRRHGVRRASEDGMGVTRRSLVSLGLAGLCVAGLPALSHGRSAPETPRGREARLRWFREAKFGVFICWGPCSLAEGEIGWSRNGPRPGIPGGAPGSGVPVEVYDNLYKRFNPTRFDAREWASLVKASGAKYVIFLTRHHDGFSMFDSALTSYKVTNTPYGRDVTNQVADALREAGIRIVWYYSQPDWRHPDYLTANHSRFLEYMHGQVRELLTNYGRIDGLWFDGLYGTSETWDSPKLIAMARKLQPGIIINNRAGLPEDFDTPEQTIGRFQIDRAWESCITINEGWSWLGEKSPLKSLKECLHLLIRCAGGGGNLALDTGPLPDGRIDPRQAEIYRGMGAWLARYGESVYATTGGPYTPTGSVVTTRRGSTVYVHVLRWDGDIVRLPPLGRRVRSCRALTGGTPTLRSGADGIEIGLPPDSRSDVVTVFALELAGSAMAIKPISARNFQSLTVGRRVTASSEWSKEYSAAKAFDGDDNTRWGAAPDARSGWLEVDLGSEK
ncbi:MAG: hypothetical protein FJX72_01730, partial [Armatimonadetes bacterium]|nr:hypothetical protein [Armatimonadota bacterium]